MMIVRLVSALRSVGLDPTLDEVADALWLAAHLGRQQWTEPVSAAGEKPPGKLEKSSIGGDLLGEKTPGDLDAAEGGDSSDEKAPDDLKGTPSEQPATVQDEEGREQFVYPRARRAAGGARRGIPIRSPGALALPGSLELTRALRPLMRRVPSRTDWVIDEKATAQRVAEEGIWTPVTIPAPARWLSVSLVVDTSPSMRIWHRTVEELELLLLRLGAFREVAIWSLNTSDPEAVSVSRGPGQPSRKPKELLAPARDRLIVVVTDGVAPAWYSGAPAQLLETWGKVQAVALLQMLPQQLWQQTGLAVMRLTRVRAMRPGVANAFLKKAPMRHRWRQKASGIPVPVFTLEPGLVAIWAGLVAGNDSARAPALLLERRPRPMPVGEDERGAEQRLEDFRLNSSSIAFRLVGLLAAAPLSLPVMRLVQHTLMPESRQVHLAEIFLGGLLCRVGEISLSEHPDAIQYDFLPGVRDLLLDTGLVPDAVRVQRTLSQYMAERLGRPLDFNARR